MQTNIDKSDKSLALFLKNIRGKGIILLSSAGRCTIMNDEQIIESFQSRQNVWRMEDVFGRAPIAQ